MIFGWSGSASQVDLGTLVGADGPGDGGAVGGDCGCGGGAGLPEGFDEGSHVGIGSLTSGWEDGTEKKGEAEGVAY